jgi:hypothetical protein
MKRLLQLRLMQMTMLIALVLVLSAWGGCSWFTSKTATQSLLVTDAFLEATGQQFLNASTEFTLRCAAKPRRFPASVSDPLKLCNDFDAFTAKFKPGFHHAKELWVVGKRAKDASMTGNASDVLNALASELAPFALAVLGTTTGGK